MVWQGDQLLALLLTDFERRYEPGSTTRSNSRPTASSIRHGRMFRLANLAIPRAQRRMVEPENADTASPNKSTSSTLSPGPANDRDPATTHPRLRLRLQIDRRLHTCGRMVIGGVW